MDARKAHRKSRFMTARSLQTLECDFENQAKILSCAHRPDGSEALDRVVAHELVDLFQLFVGEPEISLADRRQNAIAVRIFAPDTEGVVGIVTRTFAVPAL